MSGIEDLLARHGLFIDDVVAKSLADLREARRLWRDAYSHGVYEETGEWIYRSFDWKTFSEGFAWNRQGERAVVSVNEVLPARVTVFSDGGEGQDWCVECVLTRVESTSYTSDIIVAGQDWTFVMPHETGMGPYYSVPDRDPY